MTTISAKVVAESVSPDGHRLTTLRLCYPRRIHAEVRAHRQLRFGEDQTLRYRCSGGATAGECKAAMSMTRPSSDITTTLAINSFGISPTSSPPTTTPGD